MHTLSSESRMLDWPSGIQNTRRRKNNMLFRPYSPLSGVQESWELAQVKSKLPHSLGDNLLTLLIQLTCAVNILS